MSEKIEICPRHNTKFPVGDTVGCPDCNAFLMIAPNVELMSCDEKLEEFDWWFNEDMAMLTVPWNDFQHRISCLVGRAVFTHEFTRSEYLRSEISNPKPEHEVEEDMLRLTEELVGDKLIVFNPDNNEIENNQPDTHVFDDFINEMNFGSLEDE